MERRRVLQILALGGTGTALGWGSPSLYRAVVAHEADSHWGYVGDTGPDRWGQLSPTYQVCGLGQDQSPIDLHHPIPALLSPLTTAYQPVPLKLLNNGHTLQVNIDAGNTLNLEGKSYTLTQFHFHHPSEHTVAGATFPLEMHLVHTHGDGSLAVLGVFIQAGTENALLQSIWEAMPRYASEELTVPNTVIDPNDLIPSPGDTFRYFGSLTTPPCSEVVAWFVFQTPLEASRTQIEQFRSVFGQNARPVQPQNRRILLESL